MSETDFFLKNKSEDLRNILSKLYDLKRTAESRKSDFLDPRVSDELRQNFFQLIDTINSQIDSIEKELLSEK